MNKELEKLRPPKRTQALCAVAVGAVLIATLWPLNPFPRNGVAWLPGEHGLKFEKAGLAVSNEPLKLPETNARESYTLELLLRPASTKSSHTILAFYNPTRPRQLLITQWTDGLLVTRDATVEHDRTRTIKFDVDHVFSAGKLVFVAISSGPHGTTVYVNDQSPQSFPRFKISRSELSAVIVLGTSPVTYHPWQGEIRGLAIYAKEIGPEEAYRHYHGWTDLDSHPPDLDAAIARYAFTEGSGQEVRNQVSSGPNLAMPRAFSVPHKPLLQSAVKEFSADWRYAVDVGMNIAGFVPLGLIFCAYLAWTRNRWKAILLTAFFCGILSFVIEVLQYYVPRRASGTTDIITNTLGAALGAALMQASITRIVLKRMKLIPKFDARGH